MEPRPERTGTAGAERLLDGLPASFTRAETSRAYRLGIALSTLVVVLLPLLYLALVAAVAWGVVWYARDGQALAAEVRGSRARGIAYFGPLVIGGILVFFLLKPLLARGERREKPFELRREREPALFAYVERLAALLGVPAPRRIAVDLDVNASASFTHGLASVLGGGLTLTLGLPLVSTLSLRELSAILAHEFGHFAQGAGMRFYYATQLVNRWLLRVAFERDRWDAGLADLSRRGCWYTIVVLLLARGVVWATRGLLAVLARAGSASTAFLSRQMEFDADHNAVLLAGSRAFGDGLRALARIEAAQRWAQGQLAGAHREGRLADDFPRLVRHGLEVMPAEVSKQVLEQALEEQPEMYATHPPVAQRIARAREIGAPGGIALEAPASALFADYASLCREVSLHHYRSALGRETLPRLVPTESLIAASTEREELARAGRRFFLDLSFGPASLDLARANLEVPADPAAALEKLRAVRAELVRLRPEAAGHGRRWGELETRRGHTLAAELLEAHRVVLRDARKGEPELEPERGRTSAEVGAEADAAYRQLGPAGKLSRERIALVLGLAGTPLAQTAAGQVARARTLVATLARLRDASEHLRELQREQFATGILLAVAQRATDSAKLGLLFDQQLGHLADALDKLRRSLRGIDYPFEHERTELDVERFVLGTPGTQEERKAAAPELAQAALAAWGNLCLRLLGELARICLRVEEALGLEPLPEPPEEDGRD